MRFFVKMGEAEIKSKLFIDGVGKAGPDPDPREEDIL